LRVFFSLKSGSEISPTRSDFFDQDFHNYCIFDIFSFK